MRRMLASDNETEMLGIDELSNDSSRPTATPKFLRIKIPSRPLPNRY